jgi:hypothetical protein
MLLHAMLLQAAVGQHQGHPFLGLRGAGVPWPAQEHGRGRGSSLCPLQACDHNPESVAPGSTSHLATIVSA